VTDALRANSIAIIGMAGRFPGANSVERFWSNIAQGVESITFFSDEEMLAAGVDRELVGRSDFVKAAPVLDDIEKFDAGFFKINRREAEMMDPQQRILLELAWETFERAGYAGESQRGPVGVFTGAGGLMSSYLLSPFHLHARLIGGTGSMQCIGNDKDYLSTRISYKLNLCGPSMTVQTACSTSLVAVHLACQSLLAGDCDMALAGGVTIRVPHRMGYLHSAQALLSPDGHCRAFDADAKGTLFGSGAGLVLLKPLTAAVADGDHIHAVIRGSAVTNDGAAKLSYWATNAEGQTAACSGALAVAEVEPQTIGYMEAHGTATTMGDPVEIFGLTKAFRRGTQEKQFCALGSVKTNLGHLEAAAGIVSLIKAALALEHRTLPPSLHFSRPNPAINFAETPFYVNTECRPWASSEQPRRAGVNSLGIGGTNAHVVLEEAPVGARVPRATGSRVPRAACLPVQSALAEERPVAPDLPAPPHLLTLSAKTPQALRDLAARYADHLNQHPDCPFNNVCFTANTGRGHFPHRLAVVARSTEEARQRLATWSDEKRTEAECRRYDAPVCAHGTAEGIDSQVVFLFSSQDSCFAGMGRQLYESQPVFRQAIDRCDAIVSKMLDLPVSSILLGRTVDDEHGGRTVYAEPALLALQYSLAELWKSWGVVPSAVIGHGAGEYAAACVAGVFTIEEALELAVTRAQLVDQLHDDGRMLAVMAGPCRVTEALGPYAADVALAAFNGPRQVVLSGRATAIEAAAAQLHGEHIRSRLLPVAHALHSPSMAPVMEEFRRVCDKINFRKPRIRMIAGLSGKSAGATDKDKDKGVGSLYSEGSGSGRGISIKTPDPFTVEYWCRHLCEPIRFADGIATLDEQGYRVFVEIGSQPRLLGLGRRSMKNWAGLWLPSLKPPHADGDVLLSSLARLYVHGVKVDWAGFHRGFAGRRVVLPTYPFQRQRYWMNAVAQIKQEVKDEVRILAIDNPRLVDTTAIEQCYREIVAALDTSEESNVLVDFSRVSFMSSMALGMLVRVNKKCKEYKASLKLSGISRDIREVFKITGMDKIFDIQPNAAEAIAAFRNAGRSMFRKTKPGSYEVT
jgi:anti-anti-sigma factor